MFVDRREAGKRLAEKLGSYQGSDTVVLALPRGGVVVGYEVAKVLRVSFDIVVVRKVGHPVNTEYAIGSVGENGSKVVNEKEVAMVDPAWIREEFALQKKEAQRRSKVYRMGKEALPIAGKTVIIIDDGIATGLSMRLAVRSTKVQRPARVIVAVPVAPPEALEELKAEGADEVIVLEPPENFEGAVGNHYEHFEQVEDAEVIKLLQ